MPDDPRNEHERGAPRDRDGDPAPPKDPASPVTASPAILHEFTVVRAELLLLAEDLAVVNDELDHVRDGTHPWVERVDADLAAVRGSLTRIGEDVAAATLGVHQVLAGIEHLVRLADGGPSSAN